MGASVPIYRRLDANWDYTWGAGLQNFLTKAAAVGQMVVTRLRLWKGEWFLDVNDGLPMVQGILGYAGANKTAVDRLIASRILGTTWQGQTMVTSLTGIASSYNASTREYSFAATIETAYGQISLAAFGANSVSAGGSSLEWPGGGALTWPDGTEITWP